MKNLLFLISFILALFALTFCKSPEADSNLHNLAEKLKNHDTLSLSSIMVVGTHHFSKEILQDSNQQQLEKIVERLAQYNPTKIFVEWNPSKSSSTNKNYQLYLKDSFDISSKYNEVYQIGFKLANLTKHEKIYLFDNQPEFIGSLENFSFKSFDEYAKKNDSGFYNLHEKRLIKIFNDNDSILKRQNLYDHIALRNSPNSQKINRQRMHMYEIRVGIQKSWMGPDWLGRWYQRNIRMAGNILKVQEPGDRILVIVGDNHKWTLDMLFENIPDFKLESSWDLLSDN